MTNDRRVSAIIYAPNASNFEATSRCLGHLESAGYRLVGIVQDWRAVERMLAEGTAHVVIVDRRTDIPIDDRVRVVAELTAPDRFRSTRVMRTSRLGRHRRGGAT